MTAMPTMQLALPMERLSVTSAKVDAEAVNLGKSRNSLQNSLCDGKI
jgi:hypothetical protein